MRMCGVCMVTPGITNMSGMAKRGSQMDPVLRSYLSETYLPY